MGRGFRFLLVASPLSILLVALPLQGQVNTADILGTITDSSGAVLPRVKVTVENLSTNIPRQTVSGDDGNYIVTLLPAGRYRVRAEQTGFNTYQVPEVALAVGDRLRLDMRLEVGAVEQSVEVVAQTPALQSESSTLGSLVNEHAVQDIPLNGRNFVGLARLTAGATEGVPNALSSGNRPDDRRRPTAFGVNGQHDVFNNFLIDGMDNNVAINGMIIVKPSLDALAEFRVQTNLYSAEVGRTAGGVMNLVTKSGTNDLHGSAFEFFRNERFDARNYFAGAGAKPPYRQNQFGGSVGGAIRKNRTFFFTDYEGLRTSQGQTYVSTVPTAAMQAGNFSGINPIFDPLSTKADPSRPGVSIRDRFQEDVIPVSRMDPVSAKLIQLYPAPTAPGPVNNYTRSPARTQRDDMFDVRLDEQLSSKHSLFTRFSFNDTTTVLPPHLPKSGDVEAGGEAGLFAGSTDQRSQGVHLNYVRTIRPNLVVEAKGGYARFSLGTVPPNFGKNIAEQFGIRGANVDQESSGLPPIAIAGFRAIGDATFIPLYFTSNVFQGVGSISYIRGTHNLKAGGDIRRRRITTTQSPQAKGSFTFNGNFTNDPSGAVARSGNGMASFLVGYPSNTVRNKVLFSPGIRETEFAWYVQDDWRVMRWLTLNIGLRYDYLGPVTEYRSQLSNIDLGRGKIIRANRDGISKYAGVEPDFNNVAPRFGFAATLSPRTVLRGGFGVNYYPFHSGNIGSYRNPPLSALYAVDTTPLFVDNRLSDGLPLPVPISQTNPTGALSFVSLDERNPYVFQYNLTVQREIAAFVWSTGYVAALGRKQLMGINMNLATPGPGAIQPRRQYYSLFPNVQAMTQAGTWGTSNYHSLQASVERRFKSGLNLLSNYTWSHNIDDMPLPGGGKPGTGPFPQLVTNRRIERGSSDLDIRHRWTFLANYELPFAKSATGVARLVESGWQVNAVAILQSGPTLTVQNGSPLGNTGGGDRPNVLRDGNLPADQRSLSRWFDTAAFVPQPLFQIGNVGRNTLFGPGRAQLDFSAFKMFRLTERTQLQFRAEIFNITNSPNFGVPGNSLGTTSFGVVSDTANTLPRNIQFALKLLF